MNENNFDTDLNIEEKTIKRKLYKFIVHLIKLIFKKKSNSKIPFIPFAFRPRGTKLCKPLWLRLMIFVSPDTLGDIKSQIKVLIFSSPRYTCKQYNSWNEMIQFKISICSKFFSIYLNWRVKISKQIEK